jgi:hypothetical protein
LVRLLFRKYFGKNYSEFSFEAVNSNLVTLRIDEFFCLKLHLIHHFCLIFPEFSSFQISLIEIVESFLDRLSSASRVVVRLYLIRLELWIFLWRFILLEF